MMDSPAGAQKAPGGLVGWVVRTSYQQLPGRTQQIQNGTAAGRQTERRYQYGDKLC
jgi:hypothetical protein